MKKRNKYGKNGTVGISGESSVQRTEQKVTIKIYINIPQTKWQRTCFAESDEDR